MGLMEWTGVFGNVGEFVGAIAVFLTLFYVAVQVRHGRHLLEESRVLTLSQVYQNRADSPMENQRLLASDERLAPLLARIETNGVEVADEMTMEDKIRLRAWDDAQLLGINNVLYQSEIGVLIDRDVVEAVHASLRANMRMWVVVGCRIPYRVDDEFSSLDSG